jgi:hypothetical protein
MSRLKLRVAGFGYTADPAGTGGEEYQADDHGAEGDAVWFRIPGNKAKMAKLTGWKIFGDVVGKAYLGPEHRQSLRSASVKIEETEVRGAGMSDYVLWLVVPH